MLAHRDYVAGGPLVFECRPKGTPEHAQWRESVKIRGWDLVGEASVAAAGNKQKG